MNTKRYGWENKAGWCALDWSESGLTKFIFGSDKKEIAAGIDSETVKIVGDLSDEPTWVKSAVEQLDEYFDGARTAFKAPLDFSASTDFRCRVWKAAMKIPYGKTCSYKELADAAGSPRSARAVGNALGANPLPVIVPCHRILKSDGALGGFSIGIDVKKDLLALEQKGKACSKK